MGARQIGDSVRAAEVYAALKAALGPALKAAGFKRSKIWTLAWSQNTQRGPLSFWFQCDQYGWMRSLGSRFTLEFQLGEDGNALHNDLRRRERFTVFLSGEDLETLRRMNNEVLGSLPPPSPGDPILALPEHLRTGLLAAYAPRPEPYGRNEDPWFHYYTHAHVGAWADFLERRIVALSAKFLEWTARPA